MLQMRQRAWIGQHFRKPLQFVEACKYCSLDVWGWRAEAGLSAIGRLVGGGRPAALGKLGSTELASVRAYIRTRECPDRDVLTSVHSRTLCISSGIFPPTYDTLRDYCGSLLENVLPEVDALASWFNVGESAVVRSSCSHPLLHPLACYSARYLAFWGGLLVGKRVLVVHPFVASLECQLDKARRGIAVTPVANADATFDILRMPHLPHLVPPNEGDWRSRLRRIQDEMSGRQYDIALIGAGAYSLPLAVHAKRMGRVGIHLGGDCQIWFGILGCRWLQDQKVRAAMNEQWIRPLPEDTPPQVQRVEDGCYW